MHLRQLATATLCASICACGSSKTDPAAEQPQQTVVVSFTSPTSPIHSAAELVPLQVFISEPSDRVELLRNGAPFAVLAPPYQYAFLTALEDEGRYEFVARARVGGAWKESAPFVVFVDRTPPSVESASPPATSSWATPLDPIGFTFSEPVDAATVPAAVTLRTEARGEIECLATLGDDGRTVTVVTLGPISAEDRVHVTVAGVRDLAGHVLEPASWWFDVQGAWHLLGGGPIPGGGWVESPLALEPGTSAILVGTSDGIQRYDGTTFTPFAAEPVARLAAGAGELWNLGPSYNPQHLRRWRAGAWEFAAPIPTTTIGVYPSDLVLLPVGGSVLVGWIEREWTSGVSVPTVSLLNLRRWDGASWHEVATIDRSNVRDLRALRAATGTSGPFVAYEDDGLKIARLDGDALTPLPAPSLWQVTLAVGPAGELYAAGVTFTDPQALAVERLTPAGWARVGETFGEPAMYSAIACDAFGRIAVAWTSFGTPQTLRVKRWEGGAWVEHGGALNVDAAGSVQVRPALLIDAAGRPVVAWSEQTSASTSEPELFVKRLQP